ncbi:MAG: hypothetical protein KDB00_03210 [Planctomycetales bacterium]|nr:hypothetical protein [Planctomycetales bacterium]
MFCICMPKVAQLAATIGAGGMSIEVPPLPAGAANLAMMASVAAAINATADLAASGALEAMLSAEIPALSLEGVLAMEAMAQVGGAMGIEMTSPSASMDLSLAAGSLNITAPALGELGAALGPAMESMGGLPMSLAISAAIQSSLGIDMSAPGAAAALEASFAAALEASAALSASGSIAASFSAEAAFAFGLAARALNAAIALGFQPGDLPSFAASLEATAGLEIPPLSMSAEEMGGVTAGLADLGLINQATGGAAIEASLPALQAGAASIAASMEAAMEATASMAAELAVTAEASGQLGAALSAAIAAPMGSAAAMGGLELGGLPSMGDLSVAASMAMAFEAAMNMPMISGVPCPNIFCVAGR